jgi:NADP-dependent 3-hydroxy acid dehydrogenase YdfG
MKVIVITGASSGIGAELAKHLGAKGHRLVLAARREQELKQVALQSGGTAIPVVCDVSRRQDVDNLKSIALDSYGQVDVWVNNAGRGINRKVMELTDEDFDEMMTINVKSALYGIQAIIPHFQERGEGHLINVSSFLGRVPWVTFRSAYSAAKTALNALTANLRMDLKETYPGIHISLVMPGMVTTEFGKNALSGMPTMIPSSRPANAQSADEVAHAIVDLIDHPQPEIFTNPALADISRRYYQDIAAFEAGRSPR